MADKDLVVSVFDADETQSASTGLAPENKPAIAPAIVERISATVAPDRGACEKPSHQGEKACFVVERSKLDDVEIVLSDHAPLSFSCSRRSRSWRA